MMTTTVGLPREWCRGPQWASPAARREWEPVLRSAQRAWEELEVASVTEGVRDSALVPLTADELPVASADCARVRLCLTVLEAQGGSFRAAVHRRYDPDGEPLAEQWVDAWGRRDDSEIGSLLGFPACCRAFFKRHWVDGGSYDVTRAMPTVSGPWQSNIMLRWLGVRLVPHLPCSGFCRDTYSSALRYLAAGKRSGVDAGAIERLLRLPVTYDAAGGVAVVSTPHFRFMLSTDPGAGRADRPGEPTPHEDNGFSSGEAMSRAHEVVLRACDYRIKSALDLGCGDGALLELLSHRNPGAGPWVGIEADLGRAQRGYFRRPGVSILRAKIQDPAAQRYLRGPFNRVLLMPGRLTEMAPADARRVRDSLREKVLVLYAYGDVLERHGGLTSLANSVGLRVIGPVYTGNGDQSAEGVVS